MKNAKKPNDGFAVFLTGVSLRQVAEQIDVSFSTVFRWSRRYSWVVKRQLAWQEAAETTRERHTLHMKQENTFITDHLFSEFTFALAQRQAFREGKLPRNALKYSTRDLCRLAMATVTVGSAEYHSYYAKAQKHSGRG